MAQSSDNPSFEFSPRTRQRSWDFLKNNPDTLLNVVIIGGGIVGAGVARELGIRNVSNVFLFEKDDFASGTSSASSKLVHAGIRYLEQVWLNIKKGNIPAALASLKFVVDASHERKTLGRMAPHLIKPKPIFLVLGESDERNPLSILSGVWLYWFIQIFQGQFFSPPKVSFRKDAVTLAAMELRSEKVKAMFSFWDSETDDARLVIENLQSAASLGVQPLNYIELLSYEAHDDHIQLELKNRETNERLKIKTRLMINATGPWIDSVRATQEGESPKKDLVDKVAGSHLDIYPALTKESYYITAPDGRLVFFLTRNEDGLIYTRVGTTERVLTSQDGLDNCQPSEVEIAYLKAIIKEYLPVDFSDDMVIRSDAGIRPLRSQDSNAFQKSREHDIVRENRIFHMVGVKLTDFRRVSAELMHLVPWQKWGIQIQEHLSSADFPLESKTATKMYPENTVKELIEKTMALHWIDIVRRRRGLQTKLQEKINPALYEDQLKEMATYFGWNSDTLQLEKKKASHP